MTIDYLTHRMIAFCGGGLILFALFVTVLCGLSIVIYREYANFEYRLQHKPVTFREKLATVGWYLLCPVPVIGGIAFSLILASMVSLYLLLLEAETLTHETEVNITALERWLVQNQCDTTNPRALIEDRVFKCEGNDWCRPKHEGGLHWECESSVIYRWSE